MSKQDEQCLSGKTAVVTGSTSGIGLGIAKTLASRGANVMLNGFVDAKNEDDATAGVRSVATGNVAYHPADVSRPDQVEALIAETKENLGSPDILVNNAGIQHVAPVHTFPIEKWDQIIAVNLSAAFHTIRCATPLMLNAGWGRIVNIASAHALVASPYKSAYVAAKHGIAGLTKTVALELAESNITVNAVAPGYVETPLVSGQVASTAKARGLTENEVIDKVMLAAQPTRQFVRIDQVSELVFYLCTDAAAQITGSVLPIDGGWTAH